MFSEFYEKQDILTKFSKNSPPRRYPYFDVVVGLVFGHMIP
jgi:hypothetical protein